MERPQPSTDLTEQEFSRWYWTLAELQSFARTLEVSPSGSKLAVRERIAAQLGGREHGDTSGRIAAPEAQLSGSLDENTVIPEGQRATQHLRTFFTAAIGPSFRFDGHMRQFLQHSGGATLGDAMEHWRATRGTPLPDQSPSLEFNAFTKLWHREHPTGSAQACRAAWKRYRSLPADQRPPVVDA